MSTHPNFLMVVDNLVEVPRGMLARGRVEGGEIHQGDAVLVGNAPGGKTVQVGQISVDKKVTLSAEPGSVATLLLAGLGFEDIRPGDRLLPGQAEQVVLPPEAKPWEPLPQRIYPILRLREILGPVVFLAFLVMLMAVPVVIIVLLRRGGAQGEISTWFFLISLVFLVIPGLMAYRILRGLRRSLKGRQVYGLGHATTTAHILNRQKVYHSGKYSDYFTYGIRVEVTATLAQVQRYQLPVSKKLYDQLLSEETVPLTYATQDPRIFMIEGEPV